MNGWSHTRFVNGAEGLFLPKALCIAAAMAARRDTILIVGGGSRIAASLARIAGERVLLVSRRPTGFSREIAVADYDRFLAEMFEGVCCVVNCVGISQGDAALMQRVNVDMPVALARAALASGVSRFIHVSSFSVYGGARRIDRRTPTAPATLYGQSKLAADDALLSLADAGFAVAALRLPLIYGRDSLGKLGRLLKSWARLRLWPVPADDVERAMIGTDVAAEVLVRLCDDSRSGILFAADPQPFTYAQAAAARPERLRCLPVPRALTRAAEHLAPAVAQRLFTDSRLADDDNLAIDYGIASRLYDDIAEATLS